MAEVETTVFGGLPVSIYYDWDSGDQSVGMPAGVDYWEIIAVNGRKCKKQPEWLNKRIHKIKGEEDRIFEACRENEQEIRYYRGYNG